MTNPYAVLSFATGDDYWTISDTGEWAADNDAGRAAAAELMRVMHFQDAPFLLGHVMKAMVAKGRWSGVETGFAQAIAERAGEN